MPELPEVETIRSQLKKTVLNKQIKDITVADGRVVKGTSLKSFILQAKGKRIRDVLRRGKVLILRLESDLFLVFHLRISGWIVVSNAGERFSRVIFRLSGSLQLHFCDRRVLGEIRLVKNWEKLSIIETMGPEPLEINKKEFLRLFIGKKTRIKPLLMDQHFLAGVGNIYAQEALFCAGIDPRKRAQDLLKSEINKLYHCLVSILKQSVDRGGSSIDTYRQIDGRPGGYVPLLKVYQRHGKPCMRCKTLIQRIVISGRGTCFCTQCKN